MVDRGKVAVLTIVVAALVAAGFAWWWRYQQGHRAARFWGQEAAALITHAPRVELVRLGTEEPPNRNEVSMVPSRELTVVRSLKNTPGLIHARHALSENASFNWSPTHNTCHPHWRWGLKFTDGGRTATVLFDLACGKIRLADRDQSVQLTPRIAQGWRKIIEREANDPS